MTEPMSEPESECPFCDVTEQGIRRCVKHRLGATPPAPESRVPTDQADIATLDVFLAAYQHGSDDEVLASVIEPTDDLLTLGALRRILAALSPVPASASDAELIARLRRTHGTGDLHLEAADRLEALAQPAGAYQVMRQIIVDALNGERVPLRTAINKAHGASLAILRDTRHEHNVARQQDEYACSCGKRWDVGDGVEHPPS